LFYCCCFSDGLELVILLSSSPECWDYRCKPPCPASHLISKVKIKRPGGVAQVIEHLPSKNKALGSTLSTVKKKKREREKTERGKAGTGSPIN
jgi:hypothetical protein